MDDFDFLKCSKCRTLKRTSEFYPAKNDRGFRYYCKECEAEEREARKEKQRVYYQSWYEKNKNKFKKKRIKYTQDINVKMKKSVREFFINCAKSGKNAEQFEKTFGYKLEELKKFESSFKNGIRWGNLGTYWGLYHYIPETAYNFSNESDIRKCWNIKNLFVCLNEEYIQRDKVNIMEIKELGLIDLMPDFIVL